MIQAIVNKNTSYEFEVAYDTLNDNYRILDYSDCSLREEVFNTFAEAFVYCLDSDEGGVDYVPMLVIISNEEYFDEEILQNIAQLDRTIIVQNHLSQIISVLNPINEESISRPALTVKISQTATTNFDKEFGVVDSLKHHIVEAVRAIEAERSEEE